MAGRLREEIRQSGPFRGPEVEAHLNLERSAALLSLAMSETLKPYGLTPAQYNVLRILRGAGGPLTCGQVRERLVTPEPDVTRLLDRLQRQGFAVRERSAEDRRRVVVEITEAGRRMLEETDGPVHRRHDELLGHMGREKLRALIELLEEARERIG